MGAVIAAAGAGTRLGKGSKGLVEVGGRPLISWALRLFAQLEVSRMVVVGPAGRLERVRDLVDELHLPIPCEVTAGGETRQQSVHAGLRTLGPCDVVFVHDAARPMATAALAQRVLDAALEVGAAVPGLLSHDAVKLVEGNRIVESLDRGHLILAQTPQAFRYELLMRAHFQAAECGLQGEDDSALVIAAGAPVAVVMGEPTNLKVTTSTDLATANLLIAAALR